MAPTKNLLLTLATGNKHKAILAETIGQMRKYATNIQVDLRAVTDDTFKSKIPHYRKLREIKKALNEYERVCFIDADVLVSHKAPNIFDEVPRGTVGMFNEAPWVPERHVKDLQSWFEMTGCQLKHGHYYNTGVIVADKEHQHLFEIPELKIHHYGEQTYFNQVLLDNSVTMYELSYKWNRMSCTFVRGLDPYDSYFIHFAGQQVKEEDGGLPKFIRERLAEWTAHAFTGGQQVMIVTGGGMGNQVATLPVVEEIMRLHKGATFAIHAGYADVFKHLEGPGVIVMGRKLVHGQEVTEYTNELQQKFQFAKIIPTMAQMPFDMTYMNSTDYHSLVALGRQLHDRRIRVPVKDSKVTLPPKTVVLHAGKNGWKSKDVPREWYEAVAAELKRAGIPIAIIGKKDFSAEHGKGYGAFRVDADFDLLDRPFAETCDIIRQGAFLLSNDSMPVHAAGAFDNWIGIVSIAKHPDLIFPYRPVNKNMSFTGPEGCNLWDLKPRKAFYLPNESVNTVADWVDGLKWPDPVESAKRIIEVLNV